MKTVAIKASRMASLSASISKIKGNIAANYLTIASISAAVCYSGVILSSDIIIAIGAVASIGAVAITEKGGQA